MKDRVPKGGPSWRDPFKGCLGIESGLSGKSVSSPRLLAGLAFRSRMDCADRSINRCVGVPRAWCELQTLLAPLYTDNPSEAFRPFETIKRERAVMTRRSAKSLPVVPLEVLVQPQEKSVHEQPGSRSNVEFHQNGIDDSDLQLVPVDRRSRALLLSPGRLFLR